MGFDCRLRLAACKGSCAALGARVLFIPTNNALPASTAPKEIVAEARTCDIALATENALLGGPIGRCGCRRQPPVRRIVGDHLAGGENRVDG